MTEEIKEILNKLLEYFKESNINDFGYEKDKLISYEEAQILLNYITNLQKENEKLKELRDKYEEEHNNAFKLWKANMEKIPPFDKFLDYKQRNEKAIELLKRLQEKYGYMLEDVIFLLLQGGDE